MSRIISMMQCYCSSRFRSNGATSFFFGFRRYRSIKFQIKPIVSVALIRMMKLEAKKYMINVNGSFNPYAERSRSIPKARNTIPVPVRINNLRVLKILLFCTAHESFPGTLPERHLYHNCFLSISEIFSSSSMRAKILSEID